jgi:3-hydroxyisobutyrate dehydrogenase-like beta-hydroxyacid dehydrogenase
MESREGMTATTVGIVGLGLLGHAVASRLIAAGHRVVGYDVDPARGEALEKLGGTALGSAADVAATGDPVCTLLPSLQAVEDVILGGDGIVTSARAASTVVQMSTISPALTERLAAEVSAHGLRFLDCPVSGTSGMVERGHGVIFVGGDEALFRYWEPVLGSILPRPIYVGSVGQAMTLKLVANLLVALHSAAAAEALLMARRAGLDLERVLTVLTAGAGSSRMLEVRGPMMVESGFDAQMKLDLFMKDLHLIQDAAAAVGAPTPLTDTAERLYAAAQTAGHGPEDLAVVVRALEALAPPAAR